MSSDKPSRNEDEYFVRRDAELMQQRRLQLDAEASEAERRTHFMKCPKDGFDLATRELHGVQVDVCPHCGGVWLDPGELETIERNQASEQPGLLGRVVRDALSSLRGSPPRTGESVRHEPGNPKA